DVRSELGLDDKVIVGFVGTIVFYHGIELFSTLARNCRSSGDDVHFMIVGADQVYGQGIDQLRSTLDREQLSNMFTFTGPIPNTEVPNYIAAMDICLLPRFMWYGSPMKIFEYAAMRKAIVAPDQENIRDVLTHGETAILVEPENPDKLVQAVQELVRDERLRDQLGKAARERILSRHTWNKNAERILEIYQQII
ncbi:MAG: glycosyltransferase, partial [Anaerolineales bacterium]|nr:glycosyltransferase [Anaerolineales bacterium]